MSVGTISGGSNTTVVPGSCSITIDRRLLPEENLQEAYAELRAAALAAGEPEGSVTVELLTGSNGFDSGSSSAGVAAFRVAIENVSRRAGALSRSVVGVFDGRYFARDGIEIIDFGPGEGRMKDTLRTDRRRSTNCCRQHRSSRQVLCNLTGAA